MLVRDLDLSICKEFYKHTVLYSNLTGWSSNGEYTHIYMGIYIDIYRDIYIDIYIFLLL